MLNWIWLSLIVSSVVYAAYAGTMDAVQLAMFEGAKSAVTIVIGLVGVMVFMLGIMRVGFDGGLRTVIARALGPLLRRLFPEVPADHPAMTAMVMNMASNILGLGNAATPFGLKAMVELDRLNPHPGAASNAMVLFLAINTSAITLLPPNGTIAVRLAAGSAEPAAIWIPTLIATLSSTFAAITAYFLLRGLPVFRHRPLAQPLPPLAEPEMESLDVAPSRDGEERPPLGLGRTLFIGSCVLVLAIGGIREASLLGQTMSAAEVAKTMLQTWTLPLLIVALLLIGVAGRVNVYDSMIEGAKEGMQVAVRIVPYMVAILAAVAMLRSSGLLDLVISFINPLTTTFGVPAEVLPMAILRPLSGSGAFAIMSETLETYGADSFIGMLTSTLQGSTETTFYVLALYFGAARITDGRHALAACLTGDVAGFIGAVAACHLFFG